VSGEDQDASAGSLLGEGAHQRCLPDSGLPTNEDESSLTGRRRGEMVTQDLSLMGATDDEGTVLEILARPGEKMIHGTRLPHRRENGV